MRKRWTDSIHRSNREESTVSNVHRLLPRLTVNRQFMTDLLMAETPCFALGLVEERKELCGFMALRLDEFLPPETADAGFRFGHSLYGSSNFEAVHFAFEFYGFQTYNVLVNPNNRLVMAVLSLMVERGDYFFFAVLRRQRGNVSVGDWGRGRCGDEDEFPANPALDDHRCPVPKCRLIL